KIYKLLGESGVGKTTFLRAITNKWNYIEGVVTFPENSNGNLYFIPQKAFIPKGTMIEILTYPLKPSELIEKLKLRKLFENESQMSKALTYKAQNDSDSDEVLESKSLLSKTTEDIELNS